MTPDPHGRRIERKSFALLRDASKALGRASDAAYAATDNPFGHADPALQHAALAEIDAAADLVERAIFTPDQRNQTKTGGGNK